MKSESGDDLRSEERERKRSVEIEERSVEASESIDPEEPEEAF